MTLAWTLVLIVLIAAAYAGYRMGRWVERRARN